MNLFYLLYSLIKAGSNLEFFNHFCETIEDLYDYTDMIQVMSSNHNSKYLFISFSRRLFSVRVYNKNTVEIEHYFQNIPIFDGKINGYNVKNALKSIITFFHKNDIYKECVDESLDTNNPVFETICLDFRKLHSFIPKESLIVIEFYAVQYMTEFCRKGISIKIIDNETLKTYESNFFKHLGKITELVELYDPKFFFLPIEDIGLAIEINYEKIRNEMIFKKNLDSKSYKIFDFFKIPEMADFILKYFEIYTHGKYIILHNIFKDCIDFKKVVNDSIHDLTTTSKGIPQNYIIYVHILEHFLDNNMKFKSKTVHKFVEFDITNPFKMIQQFNGFILIVLSKNQKCFENLIKKYCDGELNFNNNDSEVLFASGIYRILLFKLYVEHSIEESCSIYGDIIKVLKSHVTSISEKVRNEMDYNHRCVDLMLVQEILK